MVTLSAACHLAEMGGAAGTPYLYLCLQYRHLLHLYQYLYLQHTLFIRAPLVSS
jgi:hypothetical protein